jgi:hypothetical protein
MIVGLRISAQSSNSIMRLAWLVSGPSGSGKSTWIRERAKKMGARLLRHAVRTDRSLRQGRQYLFSQHRSKEPTLIWLEGADTLTADAQAFLRRILETAAPNVEFALEVRDETTMSPPLLSRCQRILMPNISFRKKEAIGILEKRGYSDIRKIRATVFQRMDMWSPGFTVKSVCDAIQHARTQGFIPDYLLHRMLSSAAAEEQVKVYMRLGEGSSPWILLTDVCLQRVSCGKTETPRTLELAA